MLRLSVVYCSTRLIKTLWRYDQKLARDDSGSAPFSLSCQTAQKSRTFELFTAYLSPKLEQLTEKTAIQLPECEADADISLRICVDSRRGGRTS